MCIILFSHFYDFLIFFMHFSRVRACQALSSLLSRLIVLALRRLRGTWTGDDRRSKKTWKDVEKCGKSQKVGKLFGKLMLHTSWGWGMLPCMSNLDQRACHIMPLLIFAWYYTNEFISCHIHTYNNIHCIIIWNASWLITYNIGYKMVIRFYNLMLPDASCMTLNLI